MGFGCLLCVFDFGVVVIAGFFVGFCCLLGVCCLIFCLIFYLFIYFYGLTVLIFLG